MEIEMGENHEITTGLAFLAYWLDANGCTEEAWLCNQAIGEIVRLLFDVEKYKDIHSNAIREQIDIRFEERERCAKIAEAANIQKYFRPSQEFVMGYEDASTDIADAIRGINE